jgi:NAD(P)-dependent dehydrogenase (short-subunit alcohol dehydrogenase family)
MNLALVGKTAQISGSTKGVGFAIASQLAMEGTRVIINGRSDTRSHSNNIHTPKT